jgi:hypothetical protein
VHAPPATLAYVSSWPVFASSSSRPSAAPAFILVPMDETPCSAPAQLTPIERHARGTIWGFGLRLTTLYTIHYAVSSQSVADLQLRLAHAAARRLGHGQLHEWPHQTGRRGLQLVVLSSGPSSAHRLPARTRAAPLCV